jgi:hypothetical protein
MQLWEFAVYGTLSAILSLTEMGDFDTFLSALSSLFWGNL